MRIEINRGSVLINRRMKGFQFHLLLETPQTLEFLIGKMETRNKTRDRGRETG